MKPIHEEKYKDHIIKIYHDANIYGYKVFSPQDEELASGEEIDFSQPTAIEEAKTIIDHQRLKLL